ncbi:MAG: Cof-type HAD-IIB family hydrolase [Paraprevotella sp.]|nr:Cof-type HAD-IIB family hydrolase [Paraprevotella sp.]
MKYKLLVLDLDGTLTNNKKEITPYTRTTLLEAQKKGLKIALASGRPTYGIVPLADELELERYEGYILSYNGGQIIDWKTRKRMYENVLSPEVYPYLYDCAARNGCVLLSYKDEYIVSENADNEYVRHEAFLNKMKSITVPNILEVIDFPVPKFLIAGQPDILVGLESEMQESLAGRMNVFRSEPFFLELVPLGIDKARSLAVLLQELSLTPEEMIACGDGFNDLSMIKYAGLGIAMANAQDIVKAEADYITLSNEEDGVAHAVKKFCI